MRPFDLLGLAGFISLMFGMTVAPSAPSPTSLVAQAPQPADNPVRRTGKTPYRLSAGDKLQVTTFGEEKLSGTFLVNADGTISFPLIGNISVAGQTTAEINKQLVEKLGNGYVRNPYLQVEVASYRPVYILGEVARPGEYPFSEGLTVFALVAKAGGFSYRANSKRLYLRRDGEAAEHYYHLESATPVYPGDTIRIPQRFF